jgi:uncharacterized protein
MKMNEAEIIKKTEDYIAFEFGNEGSGHDWFHVDRVRKMALKIGINEGCNLFVIEMAALLHDLDDWKLTDSNSIAKSKSSIWLENLVVDPDVSDQILRIIDEVSFLGAGSETLVSSFESASVQDADRLDAIGAIGIARTFAYGGHKSRLIYDPSVLPVMHSDFEEYKRSSAPTLNHFYEKLLLIKDRLNTETARTIAVGRHLFLENYLVQFKEEWEANR